MCTYFDRKHMISKCEVGILLGLLSFNKACCRIRIGLFIIADNAAFHYRMSIVCKSRAIRDCSTTVVQLQANEAIDTVTHHRIRY